MSKRLAGCCLALLLAGCAPAQAETDFRSLTDTWTGQKLSLGDSKDSPDEKLGEPGSPLSTYGQDCEYYYNALTVYFDDDGAARLLRTYYYDRFRIDDFEADLPRSEVEGRFPHVKRHRGLTHCSRFYTARGERAGGDETWQYEVRITFRGSEYQYTTLLYDDEPQLSAASGAAAPAAGYSAKAGREINT